MKSDTEHTINRFRINAKGTSNVVQIRNIKVDGITIRRGQFGTPISKDTEQSITCFVNKPALIAHGRTDIYGDGGGGLRLIGTGLKHTYISFYPDGEGDGKDRGGYMGYPSNGASNFNIQNGKGNIVLKPGGGSLVVEVEGTVKARNYTGTVDGKYGSIQVNDTNGTDENDNWAGYSIKGKAVFMYRVKVEEGETGAVGDFGLYSETDGSIGWALYRNVVEGWTGLYHGSNNHPDPKLQTTATGVKVNGILDVVGQLRCGTGDHGGSDSRYASFLNGGQEEGLGKINYITFGKKSAQNHQAELGYYNNNFASGGSGVITIGFYEKKNNTNLRRVFNGARCWILRGNRRHLSKKSQNNVRRSFETQRNPNNRCDHHIGKTETPNLRQIPNI